MTTTKPAPGQTLFTIGYEGAAKRDKTSDNLLFITSPLLFPK